ncbi:hypothetical protein B0H12DRAFT_1330197 [Mycena haematopus]|nr:hypothetical protein B0H12DRAFT_1330197 [Mycena haematopus]
MPDPGSRPGASRFFSSSPHTAQFLVCPWPKSLSPTLSDSCDFRIQQVILSRASPFFNDMFSLPQPTGDSGVPIIGVAETGRLLDRFLRVWYPGAEMVYDMQFLAYILQRHLQTYTETNCVGVFALACRYGWGDLARAAAKQSLKLDFRDFPFPSAAHISRFVRRGRGICGLTPTIHGFDVLHALLIQRRSTFQDSVVVFRAGPSVQGHLFLVDTQQKAASCSGSCRVYGLRDLAYFIANKYVPAVNDTIDAGGGPVSQTVETLSAVSTVGRVNEASLGLLRTLTFDPLFLHSPTKLAAADTALSVSTACVKYRETAPPPLRSPSTPD